MSSSRNPSVPCSPSSNGEKRSGASKFAIHGQDGGSLVHFVKTEDGGHIADANAEAFVAALLKLILVDAPGLSAQAIIAANLGVRHDCGNYPTPSDLSDARRCVRLLRSCPFVTLDAVAKKCPLWAALAHSWDKVERFVDADDWDGFSALSHEISNSTGA